MWKFRQLDSLEPERKPHESEFFKGTTPPESLVKEFIQNALDAREKELVVVKFGFGKSNNLHSQLFEGLLEHLRAHENMGKEFKLQGALEYLTAEDFGTTGLTGTYERRGKLQPEGESNYIDFWWREGGSGKKGKDLGRWGLGKTTYSMASQIRTFWGLTRRADDDKELLMGKALLKPHTIKDITYCHYGYFCQEDSQPISDSNLINEFKSSFTLARREEHGFSVVIPLPVTGITPEGIIRAAIIHYFYPIMKGVLAVEVKDYTRGTSKWVKSDNLIDWAMTINDWKGTPWEGRNPYQTLTFVKEAIEIEAKGARCELHVDWNNDREVTRKSFGNAIQDIVSRFDSGNLIAIRVPVKIRKKNQPAEQESHFDLFIRKFTELSRPEEYYVRSGILINNIKWVGLHSVRLLFVADDSIIAEFLGDAETPSHDSWKHQTEGFTEKYENAKETLMFIKKSVSTVLEILDKSPSQHDRDLLAEIFSVYDEDTHVPVPRKTPEIVNTRPRIVFVTPTKTGFRISLTEYGKSLPLPFRIQVKVAYDTLRGNPFSKSGVLDFDISSKSFSVKKQGCKIEHRQSNEIQMSVRSKEFFFELSGFDTKRDIVLLVHKL